MPQFVVEGADRSTGAEKSVRVEASDEREAERIAHDQAGMMVCAVRCAATPVAAGSAKSAFTFGFFALFGGIAALGLIAIGIVFAVGVTGEAGSKSRQRPLKSADLHLFQACELGNAEFVKAAFQDEPNVNAQDESGKTPLMVLFDQYSVDGWSERVSIAEMLIQRGAKVDARDALDRTLLHRAWSSPDRRQLVPWLLRNGADAGAVDWAGQTPLHCVAEWGDAAGTESLIRAGAVVGAIDKQRRTPLHLAAASGNTSVVAVLIRADAEVNALDEKGYTPLKRATLSFRTEAAALLRKHGGKE